MSHSKFDVHNEEASEDWLLSYADMITLLMAFFIILASISKPDANLYEQVKSGMAKDIGNRQVSKPLQELAAELTSTVATMALDDAVDIGKDDKGLVLNLASGAMFKPSSAEVTPQMRTVLKEITETLAQPRFANYQIDIQGHTDDTPVRTPQYASNWELSSARSVATLKAMVEFGMPPVRMRTAAFADNAPRVPNRAADGTPYPENQAINRRIEIHVYPR